MQREILESQGSQIFKRKVSRKLNTTASYGVDVFQDP